MGAVVMSAVANIRRIKRKDGNESTCKICVCVGESATNARMFVVFLSE